MKRFLAFAAALLLALPASAQTCASINGIPCQVQLPSTIQTQGITGVGAAPSAISGAAAGTGAIVSVIGTNAYGTITLTTGTLALSIGNLATLNFTGLTYPNTAICTFQSAAISPLSSPLTSSGTPTSATVGST